jgi:hypothetical protein
MRLAEEVAAACDGVAGAADLVNSKYGNTKLEIHVRALGVAAGVEMKHAICPSVYDLAVRLAEEIAAACERMASAAELINSEYCLGSGVFMCAYTW